MEGEEVMVNGGISSGGSEGHEVMGNGGISNGGGEGNEEMVNGWISNWGGVVSRKNGLEKGYGENGSARGGVAEKVEGNLAEEVLEDLEEYWEDVSDRLMISRMVSDSIIKGMVSAVEQEAVEKISAKELEVANLKECLLSHEAQKAYEAGKPESFSCPADACKKHEKMREDLNVLRDLAREQFKKVKTEIEFVRVSNSLKKMGSGSELVGLGGILHKQLSGSWMHVNKMLDSLKTTVDTVCRKVDDILGPSNVSFCESHQDLDLLETLEDVVIQTVVRSLQDEFEGDLLEQNVQFCGIKNMNWLEKFNDISSLGPKLDAVMKSLSMCETELVSHGSHDFEHLHHKALSGENGTVDESNIHVAKSYDFHSLKHLKDEKLVNYFNEIITKIKRDHESALHQKTEEYYCLKREYLKVKGSLTTQRKEEEFDVLRKKIPEVISKLEDFLLENEKFPALNNNLESMEKLKHRLETLLSENRDLRDSLIHKENEVKCLKSQLSGATAELLQCSSAEENMMKLVENLKSAEEESYIEASLNEEIYRCALREQIAETMCDSVDSNMDFLLTQETANVYEIEDSEIKSSMMQELNELVLTEGIRDARRRLDGLCQKVLTDEEMRICLETKVLEKENELRLEVYEKEKLKQEILDLRTTVEQKEKFAMDLSVLLSKGREQFDLASQQLTSLREYASQQHILVTKSTKEIESLRSQHLEALEQIEVLNQKLDQTIVKAKGERDEAFTLAQEMHDKLLKSEARGQNLKKEMEMAANGFSNFFDDVGCRVSGAIKSNSLRLEDISFQLQALTKMTYVLKRTGLMYKNKLEQRYTDLQKAEAEVDLLGDEVDTLLRLLEKIYIALDHYSPVLKHYPGIMEILELVRRELTGESTFRP